MTKLKSYTIERRIVCQLCSGAKNTFPHNMEGLELFSHHMNLVHHIKLSRYYWDLIANA